MAVEEVRDRGQHSQKLHWQDIDVSVGDPIPLKGIREVGLYNTFLEMWDRFASKIASNTKIPEKIRKVFTHRFYADSKYILDRHTSSDEIAQAEDAPQATLTNKKPQLFSDFLSPDNIRARKKLLQEELATFMQKSSDTVISPDEASKIIGKFENLESIGYQLVTNQRVMTQESEVMGKISSVVTFIKSPVENINGEIPPSEKPLIIAATGYGNGMRSAAPLITELALNGNDVCHIAFPDSEGGTLNDKFVRLVETSDGLSAQAEYFKASVREMMKQNPGRKIELWGQSTGCLIWATALSDPEFAALIDGAVLIHPAGIVDVNSQSKEYIKEGGKISRSMARSALYSFVIGGKDAGARPKNIRETYPYMVAQAVGENAFGMGLRGRVWKKVMNETNKRQTVYDTMRIKDNRKILRVNGSNDTTTNSMLKEQGDNEISITYVGSHADTNLFPDTVIDLVNKAKIQHAL